MSSKNKYIIISSLVLIVLFYLTINQGNLSMLIDGIFQEENNSSIKISSLERQKEAEEGPVKKNQVE